ncbi:MAG: general secretion pathway protein GspK [Deltaproteobacteria bacterium]|nr:general secretion pathway protein GspK [Deltaproteobacteria bacterium]
MLPNSSLNLNNPPRRCPPASEEGVVLLLVIWILGLISVVILTGAYEWRNEIKLTANFQESCQCHSLAQAGVHYALGKLVELKLAEAAIMESPTASIPAGTWRGDQKLHILEIAGGRVEVRVADEGGKINLNLADQKILGKLFAALGYKKASGQSLVAAIMDWRDTDALTRPQGAESPYYLRLNPAYPAKNTGFDVVEELGWVKGLGYSQLLPHLADYFTVNKNGPEININTASLEVLQAIGFSRPQATRISMARQEKSFRLPNEVAAVAGAVAFQRLESLIGFETSPFFTILSKGMVKNQKSCHTIKAIVSIDLGQPVPWAIVYWADDYPD